MPAYMREDQDTEEQVMTQQKLLQPHVVKVVVRQMDTEPRHALLIICHGRDVRQATNMIKHQVKNTSSKNGLLSLCSSRRAGPE